MNGSNDDGIQNQVAVGLPAERVTDWERMFVGASRTLLLKFSTLQSGMRIPRLFVRREGDQRYVDLLEIAAPALVSTAKASVAVWGAESATTTSDGVVYFLLCEFKLFQNRRSKTAIFAIRVDFLSNSVEVRDPKACAPAACALMELLGADHEGVFATAGFSHQTANGAFTTEYFVVHIEWTGWIVKKVLPLPHVFY